MEVLYTRGFNNEQIHFMKQLIWQIIDKFNLPECIVKKAISRRHLIFITYLFPLKVYEQLALDENKFQLLYQSQKFAEFTEELFRIEGLKQVEEYLGCKASSYYNTPFALVGNHFRRNCCMLFPKRAEAQVNSELRAQEAARSSALARRIRTLTGRGPQFCKTTILDSEDTVYQVQGWISTIDQNSLRDKTRKELFFTTLKKIMEDIVIEIEEPDIGVPQKIDVSIEPDNNHILIITHRE